MYENHDSYRNELEHKSKRFTNDHSTEINKLRETFTENNRVLNAEIDKLN